MKAIYFSNHGSIDNLAYGDVDEPEIGEDDVLVQVKACAINHLDLWVLEGWPGLSLPKPHIGGSDIAGVIVKCGSNVTSWMKGTRVVANPGILLGDDEWTKRGEDSVSPHYRILGEQRRGGFAEYVSIPAMNLYELPEGIEFADGAAPLLVGVTAWRMLVHRAAVRAGETVLIIGAGGGLNSFAIQVAKHLGATVFALTSDKEKAEKAKKLGADTVLNYKKTPEWDQEVRRLTDGRGVDVVVDNVGQSTFQRSINVAARGGRIVTVGNTSGPVVKFDNRYVFAKQLSILGSTMGSRKDFQEVLKLLHNGTLSPVVDRVLPLQDGIEAYRLLQQGAQFGKVVVCP